MSNSLGKVRLHNGQSMDMNRLVELLHDSGATLVVESRGEVMTFTNRGVKDLFELYTNHRELLQGARVADKVTGAGAAALMALGGVAEYHTDVISEKALSLLDRAGVVGTAEKVVPYIINRAGTGQCPLESLIGDIDNLEEIYDVIVGFMDSLCP